MNNKQRLEIHEKVFEKIHMCHIVMDNEKLQRINGLICAWSFAYNACNGEASESWVRKHQDSILEKIVKL